MKKIIYCLLTFLLASTVYAINITVPSAPSSGFLLQSTSTGQYLPVSLTAGTNVTISTTSSNITISSTGGSSGGGTGNVATSTSETAGFLPYWTSTSATPATLGKVATTTLTGSAPIVLSQPVSVIGASPSAISCTSSSAGVTGCLTGTDWSTFNNKQATISVTTPITLTGASVGIVNQGTTVQVLHGNASGNASFSAVSLTADVSGILPLLNGGTATSTFYNGGVVFSDGSRLTQATSGFFFDNPNGRLGLGTSTPKYLLNLATSTPQLGFSDGTATSPQFVFRAQSDRFAIATASPVTNATSTTSTLLQLMQTGKMSLGLGAPTPAATLHLYEQNGTGASPSVIIGGNAGGDTDFWLARVTNNDATDNDTFQIGKGVVPGTTPFVTLSKDGFLGLATTTPKAPLHISATTTPQIMLTSQDTEPGFVMRASGGVFDLSTSSPLTYASSTISAVKINGNTGTNSGLVIGATNSVSAILAITRDPGLTSTSLVSIATSTATGSNTPVFNIDQTGTVIFSGPNPTLSSCGTSPSYIGKATDLHATIQVGSVSATTCTHTFTKTYASVPICNVTGRTGTIAITYAPTTAAIVFTNAALTSDIIDINCFLTQ